MGSDCVATSKRSDWLSVEHRIHIKQCADIMSTYITAVAYNSTSVYCITTFELVITTISSFPSSFHSGESYMNSLYIHKGSCCNSVTVATSHICTRLSYCNITSVALPACSIDQLLSLLHATAQVVSDMLKCDHIIPNLKDDLHWLPMKQCIVFKLCFTVYKAPESVPCHRSNH